MQLRVKAAYEFGQTGLRIVDGSDSTNQCIPQRNCGVSDNRKSNPECTARSDRSFVDLHHFDLNHYPVHGLVSATRSGE